MGARTFNECMKFLVGVRGKEKNGLAVKGPHKKGVFLNIGVNCTFSAFVACIV